MCHKDAWCQDAGFFVVVAWGQARVEVFSLRVEITAALATKRSLSSIYKTLHNDGLITVVYESFRENVQKLRTEGVLVQEGDVDLTAPSVSDVSRGTTTVPARYPVTGSASDATGAKTGTGNFPFSADKPSFQMKKRDASRDTGKPNREEL